MISNDLRSALATPTTPAKPSVAQLMGYAIHPILVAFPICLYAIATVSFIAYAFNFQSFWFRAGFYATVAGVIMAVIAAIPGVVDYFGSIPPKDEAKKVGRLHIAFNALALVLFVINAVLLWDIVTPEAVRVEAFDSLSYTVPMWISIAGLLSTLTAGYYGGTLVQQHHVGIQPSPIVTKRKVQTV